MKIRFNDDFQPERIWGKEEDLKALGITPLGDKSKDSVMWTHENVDCEFETREFENVELLDKEEECCDVGIDGKVLFGYVEVSDFEVLEDD